MRARWRFLFWISLAALIGVAWLAQRYGSSLAQMVSMQTVGMTAGAAVAFGAMVRNSRARWLGWLVMIGWLPIAYDLVRALGYLSLFVESDNVPAALFVGGGIATPITALWIALAPLPPPPVPPPLPTAELR